MLQFTGRPFEKKTGINFCQYLSLLLSVRNLYATTIFLKFFLPFLITSPSAGISFAAKLMRISVTFSSFELTKLVHGEEEAKKAESAAKALFGAGNAAEIPAVELSAADFAEGEGEKLDILSLLVKAGLAKSRSEARRANTL